MRALTLTQPWAGLVASGIKLVENRPRRMIKTEHFGDRFAIHASRMIDEDIYHRVFSIAPELPGKTPAEFGCRWHTLSRITSAVIAVATLVTFVTHVHQIDEYTSPDQARWFFGPIGYVLRDVISLPTPVPCRGYQGFWTLPEAVERAVVEQIR